MLKVKPNILRFLLVFFVSYVILSILPFVPAVRTAAVGTYNVFQQIAFNMFHPTARTDFRNFDGQSEEYDYSIYIYKKEDWKGSSNKKGLQPSFILNQNARLTAFGPFIMLISLILASPIPWKRQLFAFMIGSFLICILLAMKFSAMIDENAEILRVQGFSLWLSMSKMFNSAFRTHEFMALLIIPIWAISSLKTADWKWFLK